MEVAEAQREMREVYLNAAPGQGVAAVGAHYLPFTFLYGRRAFLVLAGVLLLGGFGLAYLPNAPFALGAWLTAGVLATFAVASIPRSGRAAPVHSSRGRPEHEATQRAG